MEFVIGAQIVALLPRLRRFAMTLCRSAQLADDLVQSTCERALANADSWTPGTRLDAWMFRILRNRWIDHLRRLRTEGATDDVSEHETALGHDGEGPLMNRLTLMEVQKAIDELPEEQREVLILICVEDFSYREAAEILSVPIGTIMSRLSRARQKLIEISGHSDRRSFYS